MNPPKKSIGTWLSIGSPAIAEIAALSGFDWVLIDLEHGCESEAAVPNQLRALRGSRTKGIVRVGAPHPDLIARVLDWGAQGIMVPHVNSAAEAGAVIRAAYYAPRGQRGYSRTVRAYDYGLSQPDIEATRPIIIAQIETLEGVKNCEAIAAIDGVDVLFVGPADLQFDLKSKSQATPEKYEACLKTVITAATEAGKASGILIRDPADLQRHLDLGFTHVAVDSDIAILRKAYQQTLSNLTR
ncbi:MAG: hypothetical protein RL693_2537 [Verrucomicrobiota bacterium]|jgi:2-dehydro-3-deoxyglucarate aldolase/4-hydroxy-2-oxoheptanedioate aldolase